MVRKAHLKSRLSLLLIALSFLITPFLVVGRVDAFNLTSRSITIGSPKVSIATTHEFKFTYGSNTTVGSLAFQYCTSPLTAEVCNAPAGLDASGATLLAQSGETGFSIFSESGNKIILTRPAAATGLTVSTYRFGNVVNPSGLGAFYIRIFTYASTDGTGSNTDFGAVVASTTTSVTINTEVPPILEFCVGVSIPTDCASASGNFIELGDIKSTATSAATSQFMAGTNADFGYIIAMSGNTMTSGNNIIPALSVPTANAIGTGQFGVNLRANTNPAIGKDPAGTGIAVPTANYNTPNLFKFGNGDTVATSPDVTDLVKFTASYIINIPSDQPLGVYNTTITYVCTASFLMLH